MTTNPKAFLRVVIAAMLLTFPFLQNASAQGKLTITGTVTDDLGEPMIGAGVLVKNTVIGTITDLDGNYSLTVDAAGGGGILVFSSLGFDDIEIPVNSRTVINVQMKVQSTSLDEVVVVGYGTQKRESVVGSISTVDASTLKVPSAQLSTSLAGQLSGVVSVASSGEPGKDGAAKIYIRGVSSFQGDSQPLVLVDGVERSLDLVDSDDIATFSILKDASASAVYGVRGANGVILITTKKGEVGRPKVTFRGDYGVTQPIKMPQFVNSEQFALMYNEAAGEVFYKDEAIAAYRDHTDPDLYPDVNWVKEMYRDFANNQRMNISINGGSDVVRYFISGSYYNESSIFRSSDRYDYNSSINYDKFNFRANVDLNLTETTILSLNLANIYETRFAPGTDTYSIWSYAFSTSPNAFPTEYSDGTIAAPSGATGYNPWNLLVHSGYREEFWNSAQSVIGLKQDLNMITEGLEANIKFSWDAWNWQRQVRSKTPRQFHATGWEDVLDDNGNKIGQSLVFGVPIYEGSETLGYSTGASSTMTTYLEGSINYSHMFADTHRIGAMFLYNHKIHRITVGGDQYTSLPYKNQGVAARLTYAYKDRYFGEFNMGYNGSENFAKGHRFGFFPAVSAGALISDEEFWEPYKDVANMFKIKASYGKVGNDQIGSGTRWLYLSTIIDGNYGNLGKYGGNGAYGLSTGRPENLNFSWEEETKMNMGVEMELFHQLRIQADYFDSHRTGILMLRGGLPGIAGLQNGSKLPYVNIGEVRNKGVDVSAEWHRQIGDWHLTGRGNFTYNRNRLLNNDEPDWKYKYQNRIGKPYGVGMAQPWGLLAIGLFETEEEIENSPVQTFGEYRVGDIKYQDINGDGRIDADDRIYLGYTTMPEITYGFGLYAQHKAFDFNVFFQGIDHVNFFLSGASLTSPFSANNLERSAIQKDVWENGWRTTRTAEENANAVYPRLALASAAGSANNSQTSSWWQRDGSYLRLKNVEIGYTVPKSKLASHNMGFVQGLRFYLSGTNLLTFSKFTLWDPENGGGEGATYPHNRVYSFGVNANF